MLIRQRDRGGRGQILVVFVLALVAMIGMTGLILDGGAAFAQQRVAQNGADAAATAGGLVIADHIDPAKSRTGADVWSAINTVAAENGLEDWTAVYTDAFGEPLPDAVDATLPIPATAWGVRVGGDRNVGTTFSRVLGVNSFKASAEATVIAGPTSTECVAEEDGCTLLPLTFPVRVSECDAQGEVVPGGTWIGAPPPGANPDDTYWPKVGAGGLPSSTNPTGDLDSMAILPLCRGSGDSTGAFGWLDLVPGMNLSQEIVGPLSGTVVIPDWFQTQTGNPNSVEAELLAWRRTPVLIPLHNQACRDDPGDTDICGDPGVNGNNTWYYVHTLAVFYIEHVYVQGNNKSECSNPPGSPTVPVTNGAGFLGCLKGWFIDYRSSGPVVPGGEVSPGAPIGIQLVH
ncbi:MAG: pilus assembly protein TadG-related protein [Chloroflexota bacterium]